MNNRINEIINGLNEAELIRLQKQGYTSECFITNGEPTEKWHVVDRRKYIAIDHGNSGAFLVDKVNGEIYNIKAYGQIDKNKKLKANLGNIATVNPKELHARQYNYLR